MGIRYGIIGSGAIGCFYGAKLIQAGCDVHFLFHSDFEHVKKNGLRVDSIDGNMFFPHVNAYDRATDMPTCDVVLIALKSTQNHILPNLLSSVVGPSTTIVLLQNGLGGERLIARQTHAKHILGGLCLVCCNKLGPGHITHLEYGKILLAEYREDEQPAGVSQSMHDIAAPFKQTGISVDLSEDLILARWKKLMWNIPFNGTCALLDTPTDMTMRCPQSRELAFELMQEVQTGAASQGRAIPDAYLQEMITFTDTMVSYMPSMMLDSRHHRPMEVESIYGEPVRTALNNGAHLIRTETLYRQLTLLNARLCHTAPFDQYIIQ